ncbi:MAG TPA: lipase, partial [Leptospiraceae bacterium]|nr:lipase [Leptospiraceae bacterium]
MLRSRLVSGFLIVVGALLAAEIGLRVLQVDSLQYYYDMKRLHAFHPDYLVGLAPNQDRTIRHYAGLWQGRFTTNS